MMRSNLHFIIYGNILNMASRDAKTANELQILRTENQNTFWDLWDLQYLRRKAFEIIVREKIKSADRLNDTCVYIRLQCKPFSAISCISYVIKIKSRDVYQNIQISLTFRIQYIILFISSPLRFTVHRRIYVCIQYLNLQ